MQRATHLPDESDALLGPFLPENSSISRHFYLMMGNGVGLICALLVVGTYPDWVSNDDSQAQLAGRVAVSVVIFLTCVLVGAAIDCCVKEAPTQGAVEGSGIQPVVSREESALFSVGPGI